MKPKTVLLVAVVALSASVASAQFDPDARSFQSRTKSGDFTLEVFAEYATSNVVVEHMVVRYPDEDVGFRFGDGGVQTSGRRYESSDEFLEEVWREAFEAGEEWFYARQTVVYSSLKEAASKRWEYKHPPIACMSLLDEAGNIVGAQVRTKSWSMYTDHWVLYPRYRAPSAWRPNQVSFKDISGEGCLWPVDMIEQEVKMASRNGDWEAYRYATATYAVVPLAPNGPGVQELRKPVSIQLSPTLSVDRASGPGRGGAAFSVPKQGRVASFVRFR